MTQAVGGRARLAAQAPALRRRPASTARATPQQRSQDDGLVPREQLQSCDGLLHECHGEAGLLARGAASRRSRCLRRGCRRSLTTTAAPPPADSPTCSVDLASGISPSRPGCQHDANTRCSLCDLTTKAPVRDADWTALIAALFRASPHDPAIFALALPAVLALAADPLLSMVDTVFVGRAGTDALAALGVNSALFTLAFVVFNFLATGGWALVAVVVGWALAGVVGAGRVRLITLLWCRVPLWPARLPQQARTQPTAAAPPLPQPPRPWWRRLWPRGTRRRRARSRCRRWAWPRCWEARWRVCSSRAPTARWR